MQTTSLKPHHYAVSVLVVGVLLVIAWKNLFIDRLVPVDSIMVHLSYPQWAYFRSHWQAPSQLLWNPLRNMGEPFLADPQTMSAYPLMWLLAPLRHFLTFLQSWIVLHTLLAVAFMGLLAHRLYKDKTAALAAGILYSFNGFFLSRATVPNYFASAALLPAVLYFLNAGSAVGLGVALALQWCAGSPPFAYLTALIVLLVVLYKGLPGWWCLLKGGLLALGLSAVQWIPFLEMLRQSVHRLVLDSATAAVFSLPPRQLLKELFLPQWYALKPAVVGDLGEVCFYVGPIALALVLHGVWWGTPREKKLLWGVGFALLLSLGSYLPGYGYAFFLHVLRFPARWLLAATAGLSLLCAAGISRIPNRGWKWTALAVMAADLMLFAHFTKTGWFPLSYLEAKPELARTFEPNPAFARIYLAPAMEERWIQQKLTSREDFLLMKDMLMPSYAMAFGIPEARSCQMLRSARADAFQQRLRSTGQASPLWKLAGISTVMRLVPGANQVDRANIQIFANKQPFPLVYLEGGTSGKTTLQSRTPGRVEATVELKKAGRLVFREVSYPGWEVQIDGVKTDLGHFEETFMAVQVPGGVHSVVFRYKPSLVRTGLLISLGTFLFILILVSKRLIKI